jgi:hypothetical protein
MRRVGESNRLRWHVNFAVVVGFKVRPAFDKFCVVLVVIEIVEVPDAPSDLSAQGQSAVVPARIAHALRFLARSFAQSA